MAHLTVRFNSFIESILRVPPIFVLDEIFRSGFNYPFSLWNSADYSQIGNVSNADISKESVDGTIEHVFYSSPLFATFRFTVSLFGESRRNFLIYDSLPL